MLSRISINILLAALLFVAPAFADTAQEVVPPPKTPAQTPVTATGFEGRIVHDGTVTPGVRVYAYKDFADLLAHRPASVSSPSGDDGKWAMDVAPGRYYLVAKTPGAGPDGPAAAGGLFSFQGSNPVTAVSGKYTHIGFGMVKHGGEAAYTDITDAASGSLSGVVTADGRPLRGAIVSIYLDEKDGFRGMGYAASPPTGEDGAFRFELLPESDYFVVARKRASGRTVGPLTDGDHFGYYSGNPVTVRAGKAAKIEFPVVSKGSEIGKDDSLFRETGTRIAGKITTKDGKPAKGVYAFAYLDKVMAHKRPEHISRPVDADGRYEINLPEGGLFYIGARSDYGDTPGPGEWYGRYEGTGDHAVKVETGKAAEGVDIVVEEVLE